VPEREELARRPGVRPRPHVINSAGDTGARRRERRFAARARERPAASRVGQPGRGFPAAPHSHGAAAVAIALERSDAPAVVAVRRALAETAHDIATGRRDMDLLL